MAKFATVLEGHFANQQCETVIGRAGFELHWNFLQIRSALQRSDDARLYETAQKDERFTRLQSPDCKRDQAAVVTRAVAVSRTLTKEVGAQPYDLDAYFGYLRREFSYVVYGFALEAICQQTGPATRRAFIEQYLRIEKTIDALGVEEMAFPEDIIADANGSITAKDCSAETESRIRESVKSARDLARNLGIWSVRTGYIN